MRQKRAGSMQSTWGFDVARRGVLLLSGGFDSPVAGHLMARQGLDLIAAHFSLEPITDDAAAIKARTLCGILGIPSLYVVRVGEAFAEVAHDADRRFYFILTKRLMVRLAEETKLDVPGLVSSCLSRLVAEKFKANGPAAQLPSSPGAAA